MKRDVVRIAGIELELFTGGQGAPLLLLHSGQGVSADQPFLDLLTERRRVIAPSHPGFGASELPDWLDSVDDIAHVYLELMDRMELPTVDLVGCSIGGWIAAEMATKSPERISRLVMTGPVGIKIGPRDRLDIPDIFAMPADALRRIMFHAPDKFPFDPAAMSDDALRVMLRNRETLALLAWEPFFHNPKLSHRLHRAAMPALFLRGESDGLVSQTYLEAYARLLPKAQVATIAEAGHAPQVEQPQAFVSAVLDFLER